MILSHFVLSLLEYMCANNYFSTKRCEKVIANMKRCSFFALQLLYGSTAENAKMLSTVCKLNGHIVMVAKQQI